MYTHKNENKAHQSAANLIHQNSTKNSPFQLIDNRKSNKNIVQRVDSDDEGYEGGSEDEEMNIEESDGETYEPESDDGYIDPEEIYRTPGTSYRGSRSFYTGKHRDTRKSLMERQTDSSGKLHSGFDGKGEVIKLDGMGREIRKHKTKGAKDKQPDIDHMIDYIAIDDEVDKYDESEMSSDETEEYKNFLYNDESNLEILSKNEHKGKKRYTRDTVTKTIRKEAKKMVKAKRADFKASPDAKRRLAIRRKLSRKKKLNL
ncbi:hypothetical protein [Tenacibaculum sp. MAR_2010_89]|uniref:hypothetical protein n=1 Tax=Tenacibaculum sp. MAR_2010_89 TaxID=1250198 RepID=UPI00115F8236|nr:hypothetical protein [Tenacibaculum sp. MAR_2010_89]